MKKHLLGLLLLFTLVLTAAAPGGVWAEAEIAGVVKKVSGQVHAQRAKIKIPLKIESKIFQGDVLITGAEGSVGIIFTDDTLLSLGPQTRLEINEYLFHPAEERLSFFTRLIQGTAAYVSGQIVKLAPESAKVETPVAVLGIRGTRFVVEAR